MADRASETFEQEMLPGQMESERELARHIGDALESTRNGILGRVFSNPSEQEKRLRYLEIWEIIRCGSGER